MPSISPPARILVTGASGYFAPYAVKDLLDKGFQVVGTVRSPGKGVELSELYAQYNDRFSCAIIPDIGEAGALHELIRQGNFDGIAHAASPPVSPSTSLEDYLRSAVDGTIDILKAIKAHGPNVKRVVYTSSGVAALHFQEGVKHTELHWNDTTLKAVKEKGEDSSPLEKYIASKTLAEKAAWEFMEENKGTVKFDLVTVLPSLMLGPPLNPVDSRDRLTSTNIVFEPLRKPRPGSGLAKTAYSIIHVRDMAALHTAAFTQPDAAGHRVIGVAADASWQDVYDSLNDEPAFPGVPKGNPGKGRRPDTGSTEWDNSFSKELLGREFIGTKQAFRETEAFYQEKGWSFM
ncbi:NAD(P)-binding protein [Ceratobasidium sp. AG-I]|nr:NAD(P)-binding protein [Ceratobasidium sp. AG-I]